MSDQRENSEIEQALTQWAQEVAPTSPPDRLLEATFARTMGASQERVWPWTRLLPGTRRGNVSGSVAGFAIAALALLVILAMAIGLVAGGAAPAVTATHSHAASATPYARPVLDPVPQPNIPGPYRCCC